VLSPDYGVKKKGGTRHNVSLHNGGGWVIQVGEWKNFRVVKQGFRLPLHDEAA